MKLFPKLLILILFIFNGLLMQQCNKEEFSCGGNDMFYKVLGYTIFNVYSLDPKKQVSLNIDSIQMDPGDTIYFTLRDSSIRIAGVLGINKSNLMACPPTPINYNSDLDSLTIQTMQNFDSQHLKGTTIDDLFLISSNYIYQYFPIIQYKVFTSSRSTKNNPFFQLALIKKPQFNSAQFKFIFYASKTGDSAIALTPVLKFK